MIRGESCTLKRTIFVRGANRRISRAASTPFITGILTLRITRSSFSSLTFSNACLAFSASPQIPRESRVRRDRIPRRIASLVVDNWNSCHDAIRPCLGQPLFENPLILGLNLDKPDSHPFVEQVMGHITYGREVRFRI